MIHFATASVIAVPSEGKIVTAGAEPAKVEERELAFAAKQGCLDAFEQLVTCFEGRLFAFLYQKTNDHHLAQDLLQSTFVIAYRKLHLYNPRFSFASWLYTIASRQAINHFRNKRIFERDQVGQTLDSDPSSELIAREQAKSLWNRAREVLSERQYDAIWHFYGEERNLAETADVMNRSVGSVKVLLHRARRKLAEELLGDAEQ